ncbi:GAF and ANTAR domain-containing protein [Streptomyces beigongshangae]|uniref:GAF and ANTAR domain-containing protein n=1 Tax=Streptomyces beigongshangae TaxID=2841597 RepID=UPI0021A6DCC6|nr:GAF and ANTAR domain-containing protein [Streptomyces sp. REN17]
MQASDQNAAPDGAGGPHDGPSASPPPAGGALRPDGGLRAVPPGTARRLGLDALTVSAVVLGDLLELVWSDPAEGLGPELEELQFTLGEGPTVQAARRGDFCAEPDLAATDPARWPAFLPAAAHTRVRSVIAVPIRIGAATVGVLTGYRVAPGPLTAARQRDVHRLAHDLVPLLLDSPKAVPEEETGPRPDLALYHAEIHQATGFLSVELGVPPAEALLRLRAHAIAGGRSLTDLARAVLARRLPPGTFDG